MVNSCLDSYKEDIRKEGSSENLLSYEQEKSLTLAMKDGDKSARERLISSNLRLVFNVANKYRSFRIPFEDIVSEGNIGLINAVDTFNVDKGCRFGTYAYQCIKNIIIAFKLKAEFTGSPKNMSLYFKIKRFKDSYYTKHGKQIKDNHLMQEFGLSKKHLNEIFNDAERIVVSINSFSHESGEEINLEEVIPHHSPDHIDTMITNQTSTIINKLIKNSRLNERESYILRMRFGIDIYSPLKNSELASILNISSSRISEVFEKALKKIKYKAIRTGSLF